MKISKSLVLFNATVILNCPSLLAKLSTQELTIVSAVNDNYDAAVLLATQLEPNELKNANVVNAVKNKFGDVKKFMADVNAKKSTGAAGAGAECLTKQQAEDIIKAPLPEIKNAADAKKALVSFFQPSETGGKLLAEIGATPQNAKGVVDAINAIAPKA